MFNACTNPAALIEARHLIVQGAVEIAQSAVEQLEQGGLKFTGPERVNIVSNVLTVTCSESEATPTLALH